MNILTFYGLYKKKKCLVGTSFYGILTLEKHFYFLKKALE